LGPILLTSSQDRAALSLRNKYLSTAELTRKITDIPFIRGGAYKPRTSPYSFRGLGKDGLKLLQQAAKQYNSECSYRTNGFKFARRGSTIHRYHSNW
jgi:hypothetical protein